MMTSLRYLSNLLYKHYEKKVIILIDEYDVPLAKAFDKGYYEQMVTLLRNMFAQALKTNDSMYFSVLTGCLRISKESIFTGLNNRDTFVRKEKKENFYHGMLLGLLSYKDTWGIWSNNESGEGDSDILVEIEDEDIGIVIEVKYSENGNLEADCNKALEQIEEMRYQERFQDMGMRTIIKYGVACYTKRCKVLFLKEE